MSENRVALSFCCHPDDTEFMSAGTLALLRQKGWHIVSATMTPGDCGSAEFGRAEISKIRREEARNSAKILDGDYYCMECDDVFVLYDRPTLLKAIELIRKVNPTVVFAPSPSDYMVDHEMTSKLVQTACFTAAIPNISIPGTKPHHGVPHLYYFDPLDGVDILGNPVKPTTMVDISSVMSIKEEMLCCHASQRNWLMTHHGNDEYILSMKRFDAQRGNRIGKAYAEGFRQHLGNAYPKTNLLHEVLGGNLVYHL